MTRPLRVLHIASGDLWAGAEVQAFTLISQLLRMPDTEVGVVLMNEGILAEALRSVAIPVFLIEEGQTLPLRIVFRMRGVLRNWRPDVIHTHRQKENILGSLANWSYANVPCVRTVHGGSEHSRALGWKGIRYRVINSLDRWCGRTLQQKVIAVTGELATELTAEFPAYKIEVIENGVDFDAVRASRGIAQFRQMEPDAIHIGIAGRLAPVKRVDLFLEMAALLLRMSSRNRWKFHVFGDGPARPMLESFSEQLKISDRVSFLGHRQDISTCIGGLDALVICSDHEGMPMIALEALALGVRTVAHAVGGLIDLVPNEFLVTQHNAQGYADGVLRALGVDSVNVAGRCSSDLLTKFSAERNARRIRELYERIATQRISK